MIQKKIWQTVFLCCTVTTQTALAHITLESPTATQGESYKAILRVGHACTAGGSTVALTVLTPEGVANPKPMPKAGWTISITQQKSPAIQHEITWKANTLEAAILDAHYDEFALRVRLPDTVGALWWKTTQTCSDGKIAWIEVPAQGTSTKGLKNPAAPLELLARKPAAVSPTIPVSAPAHVHHH